MYPSVMTRQNRLKCRDQLGGSRMFPKNAKGKMPGEKAKAGEVPWVQHERSEQTGQAAINSLTSFLMVGHQNR